MKNRNKIFTSIAVLGSAIFAMVLTAGSGIFETFGLFGKNKNLSPNEIILDSFNHYLTSDGSSKTIYTSVGNNPIVFNYSGCSQTSDGHTNMAANATIGNHWMENDKDAGILWNNKLTSVESITPVFTASTGASLQFRASYDGKTNWGEYAPLTSGKAFSLSSKPYYVELKADGGMISLESCTFAYSCVPNASISGLPLYECGYDVKDEFFDWYVPEDIFDDCVGYEDDDSGLTGLTVSIDMSNGTKTAIDSDEINYFVTDNETGQRIGTSTEFGKLGTFTVHINYGNLPEYTYEIEVVATDVESIELNRSSLGLPVGDTYHLVATISPDDATDQSITWESSNDEVATVSDNGLVTAISEGTAEITATANGGTNVSDTCHVTVSNDIPSSSYTLVKSTDDLVAGDKYVIAYYNGDVAKTAGSLTSGYLSAIDSTFSSDGQKISSLGEGTIEFTLGGNATDGWTLANESGGLLGNDTADGKVLYFDDGDTNWNISVTNAGVATIDTGYISTALTRILYNKTSPRFKTYTSSTTASMLLPSLYRSVVPQENVPVTGLSLNKDNASVYANDTVQLTPIFSPYNATIQTVTWNSDNPTYASVDSNGLVTGHVAGIGQTVAISATSTDGSYVASCNISVQEKGVTSVTLNKETATMRVGGNDIELIATIEPEDATYQDITWISSNDSVATVNEYGVVHAVADGDATITAYSHNNLHSDTCAITVSSSSSEGEAEISSFDTISGYIDEHTMYTAQQGGAGTAPIVDSNNEIRVYQNGGIYDVKSDEDSEITAIELGSSMSTQVQYSIQDKSSGRYSENTNISIPAGQTIIVDNLNTHYVRFTCTGTNKNSRLYVNYTKVTYSVNGGGGGGGTTTVPVTGVSMSQSSVEMTVGDTRTLGYQISPMNATNKTVSWTSSNNSIATVDANGKVTALGVGAVTITVTTQDGSFSDVCNVVIAEKVVSVTGVSLDKTSLTLKEGNTSTLGVTISPSDATNKNVTWTSSNNSVATVNNGVVTAVKAGSATITVTTSDGGKTATCNVTVQSSGGGGGQSSGLITSDLLVGDHVVLISQYADKEMTSINGYGVGTSYSSEPAGTYVLEVCSGSVNGTYAFKDENDNYLSWTSSNSLTLQSSIDANSSWYVSIAGNGNATITNAYDDSRQIWWNISTPRFAAYTGKSEGTAFATVQFWGTAPAEPVPVTGISLDRTSIELGEGKSTTLNVSYAPTNANTGKGVTWKVINASPAGCVTVDSGGTISGVSAGTARVVATSVLSSTITAYCDVEVTETPQAAWTIMIYICGADLESENNLATGDIQEILKVTGQPDDVNIIVQTGGASSWSSSYSINAANNQRWHVENRKLVKDNDKVYSTYASMGAQNTFKDFLVWGLTEYPADKTGVILWNHGGGMRGVCYDEKKNDDNLLNSEVKGALSAAFSAVGRSTSNKLEFIGYDACLMSVQDIADFNSQYFNYMISSEESEAGYGWDYDNWVDDLYRKSSTTTILKAICDSFISDNGGTNSSSNDQTLSFLNLAHAAEYRTAWENFASAFLTKLKNDKISKTTYLNWVISNVKHYAEEDYDYFATFDAYDFVSKVAANSTYNPGSSYTSPILEFFNGKVSSSVDTSKYVAYATCGKGAGNSYGLCCVIDNSSKYTLGTTYYGSSETAFTNWRSINLNANYGYVSK